jgi:predicted ester cyclase
MKKYRFVLVAIFLFAGLLISTTGCQNQADKAELEKFRATAGTQERNKRIARDLFAAIDSAKFDRLEALLSEDFALGAPGLPQPWKKADVFQAIKTHYASFPDWTHVIEVLVAEGDIVAVKVTGQGTQKAQYEGIAPTGKRVTQSAMHLLTIFNGKVKELWALEDNLGFMQQLGMELKPVKSKK